mmetsp:Transcript_8156/g.12268  ORF Transcript_8156/g.12268 Transcript_8156/m.12268 type:complete len:393 (+) Transcript_8156:65-1243(+)|eukprot:CAMPEP_0203664790 /NCGR_PEP_ID=MMETSP0090-20130426/2132_1 /ASSEMBLY_ACC=CAM_ASM_001088 /TAXON_ID=426623 /ORGANISM="Chaetoceros affinis, Strain CCMP159" /LENGTH=392 /DNA_ID=CAMNT_0050528147 /DNA_START=34 /DNA_END=1212 /DNA_ORIENTATION=-
MDFPVRNIDLSNEDEEAVKMVSDTGGREGDGANRIIDSEGRNELLQKEFHLSEPLIKSRNIRKRVLEKSGRAFTKSIHSNDPWMKTVLTTKERALDVIFMPWLICTINAVIWTILIKLNKDEFIINLQTTQSLYNLVLTTALAFLMVFRINRAALRWWDTRTMWGSIVAVSRVLTICILEHVNHSPKIRDEAISWQAAFILSTKQLMRDDKSFNREEMAGFVGLNEQDITSMQSSNHSCLYALASIRHTLNSAFKITDETPAAVGFGYASTMRMLEKHLDTLNTMVGGLERIKATPLPIVVVTHLRTFLLIYLLSMPIFYGHIIGWGTIPAISLISYMLLEIDGAATELECPFQKRPNHLAMELYCINALNKIQDLYIENAQRKIDSRISHA